MDLHFDPSVWIAAYGYWTVFVLIGLENMDVPLANSGRPADIAQSMLMTRRRVPRLRVSSEVVVKPISE